MVSRCLPKAKAVKAGASRVPRCLPIASTVKAGSSWVPRCLPTAIAVKAGASRARLDIKCFLRDITIVDGWESAPSASRWLGVGTIGIAMVGGRHHRHRDGWGSAPSASRC